MSLEFDYEKWTILTFVLHDVHFHLHFCSDVSECVIVVQRQISNDSVISWREQISFRWNDDDVCFVLEKHA